jgi:ABC-type ATPase with predicted acetyltransferase domain
MCEELALLDWDAATRRKYNDANVKVWAVWYKDAELPR